MSDLHQLKKTQTVSVFPSLKYLSSSESDAQEMATIADLDEKLVQLIESGEQVSLPPDSERLILNLFLFRLFC